MTSGSVRLTADGVVGVSGKPVRVYSLVAMSGSTAGIIELRDGTAATDTLIVKQTCATVSESHTMNFSGGLTFPNGCFFDKGTNVDAIVINYEQIASL